MRKLGILLALFLLTATIAPSLPATYALSSGVSLSITEIGADRNMNNGDIFYIARTPGSPAVVTLRVAATPGTAAITYSELPEGAQFKSGLFVWNLNRLSLSDSALPAAFGITFTATTSGSAITSAQKSILIVVESSPSPISVELDKTGYLSGETAKITVTDIRANANGLVQDSISSDTRVIFLPSGATQTIPLQESEEESSKFVGQFTVPAGASQIVASYKGQTDLAQVGVEMHFADDNKYTIGEVAKLVISDKNQIATKKETIYAKLSTAEPSGTRGITNIPLIETGANTGIFEVSARLIASSTSQPASSVPQGVGTTDAAMEIAVDAGAVLVAEYKDQRAEAKILQGQFSFDKSEYGNYDLASISLVSKEANQDKTKRDIVDVSVTSDSDQEGVPNRLIETGPDTAVFKSFNKILLTNNTEIVGQHRLNLLIHDDDKVSINYQDHTINASVNLPDSKIPFPPPGLNGTGGSGAVPTTADAIFSDIAVVDCAAYAGDTDKDGLCDKWEYPATGGYLKIPYAGTTYTFTHSCDPTCPNYKHKDVYVEIDYEQSHIPSTTALANVKNAFNRAPILNLDGTYGIRLHHKVSNSIGTLSNLYTWSGGAAGVADSYTDVKNTLFGKIGTEAYDRNRVYAWAQVAHYVLWADKQFQDPGSSGLAEVVGNDMIVSLGSFPTYSVDEQQGTYMHELGHNLGLAHGGGLLQYPSGQPDTYRWLADSSVNCKPNYPSVMSHVRQFTNAFTGNTLDYSSGKMRPTPIQNNVDQLYEDASRIPKPADGTVTIVWGVNQGGIRVQKTQSIDPSTQWIDWDGDNVIDNGSPSTADNDIQDIGAHRCDPVNNPIPSEANRQLNDYNDWAGLVLDFRFWNSAGLSTGSHILTHGQTIDDRREIWNLTIYAIDRTILQLDNSKDFTDPMTANSIKQDLNDRLVSKVNNVASLLRSDKLETGLAELEKILDETDALIGGNSQDDTISKDGQKKVLPILKDTIAAVKIALDKQYKDNTFTVTSLKGTKTYTITGKSDTMTATVDTFTFDSTHKTIFLDLIGQGSATLTIPKDITSDIDAWSIVLQNGEILSAQESTSDSNTITVIVDNPQYYARTNAILQAEPAIGGGGAVEVNQIDVVDITGNSIPDLEEGRQVILSTTVQSTLSQAQPFVALIEVRDSSGITVFLSWQSGILDPNEQVQVGMSWTPPQADNYTIRVFVISDLANPQVLSTVKEKDVTVRSAGTPPNPGGGGGTMVVP